jgi:hypothetical protein
MKTNELIEKRKQMVAFEKFMSYKEPEFFEKNIHGNYIDEQCGRLFWFYCVTPFRAIVSMQEQIDELKAEVKSLKESKD